MTIYSAKLDSEIRASLGDIRSDFVEQAFVRFVQIKNVLHEKELPPNIRLLLLKEIFSIFDEVQAVYDIKPNFSNQESIKVFFDLIVFVRNVLLHFPIFDTWDQINISPKMGREMMRDRKGGQIAKYLDNKFGKDDIPFEIHYQVGISKGVIKLSAIKADPEKTFLKSIISESDVILLITEILYFLYTAKKATLVSDNIISKKR